MAVNGSGSLVILVIVFLGALAFQAQVEGKPQDNFIRDKEDNVSRVIDHDLGEDTEPEEAKLGQFPWQVLVKTKLPTGVLKCGGSIIDQKWIMSAAHCITKTSEDKDGKPIAKGYEIIATRVSLSVGVIDYYEKDGSIKLIDILEKEDIWATGDEKRVFIHKDFNKNIILTNDIVLFKLKKPLTITDFVKPIMLATAEDVIQVTQKKISLTASGWGKMSYKGYKPYQTGKYWHPVNDKCPFVGILFIDSLNNCKMKCALSEDCNVFTYNAKISACGLQNCEGQIPEPTGKKEDFIGYTTYDKGNRYYRSDKYWTSGQCNNLWKMKKTSIETCRTKCDIFNKCNVFRYHTGKSMCVLQNCGETIPKPKGEKNDDWIGYFIYAVYEPHQTGKFWIDGQCENFGTALISSLEICKRLCTRHTTCNAFNYWDMNDVKKLCELKHCNPILEPEGLAEEGGIIGYLFYEGSSTNTLRYVTDLELTSGEECGKTPLSKTMICQKTPKKSVYKGDSGGPLTFEIEGIKPPMYVQIGIVSFTNVHYSSVLTNVAHMSTWIYATMGGCHSNDQACPEGTRAIITRSGSKRCVLITSCPEDEDFFTVTVGGLKQCFKVLKELATWEKANKDCIDLNLKLAEPFTPVQLRSYIVQEYGPEFFVWLGACQDEPNKMMWKRSGEEITNDDPLWYPGQPDFDEGCLLLLSSEQYLEEEPEKPFWNVLSKYEFYPLCELVLE